MDATNANAAPNSLTEANFAHGFLVDEEWIGGVTEMDGGVFAAYVSHHTTGETLEYREFTSPSPALEFLNSLPRHWIYESVGCSAHTKKLARNAGVSAPQGGGCAGCSCKA